MLPERQAGSDDAARAGSATGDKIDGVKLALC
jgi:hypothetical protein